MREKGQGVVNDAHVPEDAPKIQSGGPGSGAGGGRKRPQMSPFDDSSGGTSRIPFEYSGELGHAAPSTQLRSSASRTAELPLQASRMPTSISARSEPASHFAQKNRPLNGCADVASTFALSTIRPMRGCRTPFWNGRVVHGRLTSRRFHPPIRFKSRSDAGARNRGVWCSEEVFLSKKSMLV